MAQTPPIQKRGCRAMPMANNVLATTIKAASTNSGSSGKSSTFGMFPGWLVEGKQEGSGGEGEEDLGRSCLSVVEAVQEVGHGEGGAQDGDPHTDKRHETLSP